MDHVTTPITTFFKNRSIFITGVTGFLGEAVVEKILRTCEVKTVYVLIRKTARSNVQARLKKLLDNSVYETLKEKFPNVLNKVVAISGDVNLPNLGLNENDLQILMEQVSVVIHSAATVRFDEKLKMAMKINFQGTKEIIELCKRMKKLEALVHVSSAYINCELKELDEVIDPPPADPTKLLEFMESTDDDLVEAATQQLLGKQPNIYTFTKALAEHVLMEEAQNLPICIVRPSMIIAAWKDPAPGWVDGMHGATGLMVPIGKGILRTMMCNRNLTTSFIPVDFTVNLIISSAWYTAKNHSGEIKVYNCCSGTKIPLFWEQFEKLLVKYFQKNPLSNAVWYPRVIFRTNRIWHKINDLFIHIIPAYMIDKIVPLTGRKPVMLKIYSKFTKTANMVDYFLLNEWRFKSDNMAALHELMSFEDKKLFSLNLKEMSWPLYMENYCLGIRKYVLKDDISTLPAARKHQCG